MPQHLFHIGSARKYTSCGTCPEPGHLTAIAPQSGLVRSPRAGRVAGSGDPHVPGANRDVVLRTPPWLFLQPLRYQGRPTCPMACALSQMWSLQWVLEGEGDFSAVWALLWVPGFPVHNLLCLCQTISSLAAWRLTACLVPVFSA